MSEAIMLDRRCAGLNVAGQPCAKIGQLVGEDGYCDTHRPGSEGLMRELASKGGEALRDKYAATGLRRRSRRNE